MRLSDKLQTNCLHIKFFKYLLVFTVPRKQTLEYGILQFKNCGNENQKIDQAIRMGAKLIHQERGPHEIPGSICSAFRMALASQG